MVSTYIYIYIYNITNTVLDKLCLNFVIDGEPEAINQVAIDATNDEDAFVCVQPRDTTNAKCIAHPIPLVEYTPLE